MTDQNNIDDPAVAGALDAALASLPGGGVSDAAKTVAGGNGDGDGGAGEGAPGQPEAKQEPQVPELTAQHVAIIETIHGLGEGRPGAMDAFLAQVAVAQGTTVDAMMGGLGFVRGQAGSSQGEDDPEPVPGKDLDEMDGKELQAFMKARDDWRDRQFDKKLARLQSDVQAAKQPALDAKAKEEAAARAVKVAQSNHPAVKASIAKDFAGYEVSVRDVAEAVMRYPGHPVDDAVRLHLFPKLNAHAMGVIGQKGQVPDMSKQGKKQAAEPDWEKDPQAAALRFAATLE